MASNANKYINKVQWRLNFHIGRPTIINTTQIWILAIFIASFLQIFCIYLNEERSYVLPWKGMKNWSWMQSLTNGIGVKVFNTQSTRRTLIWNMMNGCPITNFSIITCWMIGRHQKRVIPLKVFGFNFFLPATVPFPTGLLTAILQFYLMYLLTIPVDLT